MEYLDIYVQTKEMSFEGFQSLMKCENFIDEFSSMEFEHWFHLKLVSSSIYQILRAWLWISSDVSCLFYDIKS